MNVLWGVRPGSLNNDCASVIPTAHFQAACKCQRPSSGAVAKVGRHERFRICTQHHCCAGRNSGFLCGHRDWRSRRMIGVGGGEFRIPVLIHVLRLPVRVAAGANTVIGLAVVVLGVIRGWSQYSWSADDFTLAGVMIVASLAGAALSVGDPGRCMASALRSPRGNCGLANRSECSASLPGCHTSSFSVSKGHSRLRCLLRPKEPSHVQPVCGSR